MPIVHDRALTREYNKNEKDTLLNSLRMLDFDYVDTDTAIDSILRRQILLYKDLLNRYLLTSFFSLHHRNRGTYFYSPARVMKNVDISLLSTLKMQNNEFYMKETFSFDRDFQ